MGYFLAKFQFPVEVGIFGKFSGVFNLFLAITLVLEINLAKIINSVLFYIKINIFGGNFLAFVARKSSIFSSKLEVLALICQNWVKSL